LPTIDGETNFSALPAEPFSFTRTPLKSTL